MLYNGRHISKTEGYYTDLHLKCQLSFDRRAKHFDYETNLINFNFKMQFVMVYA